MRGILVWFRVCSPEDHFADSSLEKGAIRKRISSRCAIAAKGTYMGCELFLPRH